MKWGSALYKEMEIYLKERKKVKDLEGKNCSLISHHGRKTGKRKKKEKRSNSPCRGNSKFERGRKTKGKRHKASDCSFGGGCSFIKGINTIGLLTKQLWWFKTLLPGGCLLPSSVGGYPAQLPPAERSRENSSGLSSLLWPSGSLGLAAGDDELKLKLKFKLNLNQKRFMHTIDKTNGVHEES